MRPAEPGPILSRNPRRSRQYHPSSEQLGTLNTAEEEILTTDRSQEYAYLRVPPVEELRSCVGLVLAGMAARARVGVAGLEEAIEVLEGTQSIEAPTHFRFSLENGGVVAEVAESGEGDELRWRPVVELVS